MSMFFIKWFDADGEPHCWKIEFSNIRDFHEVRLKELRDIMGIGPDSQDKDYSDDSDMWIDDYGELKFNTAEEFIDALNSINTVDFKKNQSSQ